MTSKKNILFLLFLFPFLAQAQINVMVGYDLGFKKPQEVNAAITRYNNENALSKKMAQVWNMNGLDLGLSYRLDFLTLEGHYVTRFKTVGSTQTTATETLKNYVKLNDQNYSFGAMASFGKFGFGAAWERHGFRFSKKFSSDKRFVEAFDPTLKYSTLNLFLDFHFKMNPQLGFHARPYYQLPLGGDAISQNVLDENLLLNPQSITESNTNWGYFGIKLLFSNGKQERN
jgi:hypothetical protein